MRVKEVTRTMKQENKSSRYYFINNRNIVYLLVPKDIKVGDIKPTEKINYFWLNNTVYVKVKAQSVDHYKNKDAQLGLFD